MHVKTAAKIAIACLSLSALPTLTRDIWTQRLIVVGVFTEMRTLYQIVLTIEVLLFHLPLIMFFVVLSRKLNTDGLH
jgi:hypothetical protein